jgi:hypothetical protein
VRQVGMAGGRCTNGRVLGIVKKQPQAREPHANVELDPGLEGRTGTGEPWKANRGDNGASARCGVCHEPVGSWSLSWEKNKYGKTPKFPLVAQFLESYKQCVYVCVDASTQGQNARGKEARLSAAGTCGWAKPTLVPLRGGCGGGGHEHEKQSGGPQWMGGGEGGLARAGSRGWLDDQTPSHSPPTFFPPSTGADGTSAVLSAECGDTASADVIGCSFGELTGSMCTGLMSPRAVTAIQNTVKSAQTTRANACSHPAYLQNGGGQEDQRGC